MANTFKLKVADGVTGATTIYTVPGATTAIIVGLVVANDAGADTTATVTVTDSSAAVTVKLCALTPVPAASNLVVLTNNNRIVLETGDSLAVTAVAACDVTLSVMEIT
jgi:hypothetical protein